MHTLWFGLIWFEPSAARIFISITMTLPAWRCVSNDMLVFSGRTFKSSGEWSKLTSPLNWTCNGNTIQYGTVCLAAAKSAYEKALKIGHICAAERKGTLFVVTQVFICVFFFMVLCMFLKDSHWNRPGRHEHPGSGCVCHCLWRGFEEAGRGGGDPHQVLQLLQRGHHGTGVLDHVVRKACMFLG